MNQMCNPSVSVLQKVGKAEDIRNRQPYLGAISEILTLAKYPLQLHIRQM
jgi:hypothetical protein